MTCQEQKPLRSLQNDSPVAQNHYFKIIPFDSKTSTSLAQSALKFRSQLSKVCFQYFGGLETILKPCFATETHVLIFLSGSSSLHLQNLNSNPREGQGLDFHQSFEINNDFSAIKSCFNTIPGPFRWLIMLNYDRPHADNCFHFSSFLVVKRLQGLLR